MIDERTRLASEINELTGIIAETPDRRLFMKKSLQSRLKNAQERYDALTESAVPLTAQLTFRGQPVSGSHGMAAEFAAKVLAAFSDFYAAIAAGYTADVQSAGRIPNRRQHELMITGTAVGSCGFNLELPSNDEPAEDGHEQQALLGIDEVALIRPRPADAMRLVDSVLRATAEGSDDEVSTLLIEVNDRALKHARDFLEHLIRNEAVCGLRFGANTFQFTDTDQVKRASARIQPSNIESSAQRYEGFFNGSLPSKRTFEFSVTGPDEAHTLYGKIGEAINPKSLQAWEDKLVSVTLHLRRVGTGAPSYQLLRLEDIVLKNGSL